MQRISNCTTDSSVSIKQATETDLKIQNFENNDKENDQLQKDNQAFANKQKI